MTEPKRGRGKPRLFDEDQLLDRLARDRARGLVALRLALEENGVLPGAAAGCARFLEAKLDGDSTGGVSRKQTTRYRRMLDQLPAIPLPPAPRRRSAAQAGSASSDLVTAGALAGAVAVAAQSAPVAVCATLLLAAPIMPEASPDAAQRLPRAA